MKDHSGKSILARGCDPVVSKDAARVIPPMIGNPEYVPTTTDDEFLEKLRSRRWSVIFFAPGACRFNAAGRPIPGGSTETTGWTLDDYRAEVRRHQGDIGIVAAPDEQMTIAMLEEALDNS